MTKLKVVGLLDELLATILVTKSFCQYHELDKLLGMIVTDLLVIIPLFRGSHKSVDDEMVVFLEGYVTSLDRYSVSSNEEFVDKGTLSAYLYLCRLKCGNVEDGVIELLDGKGNHNYLKNVLPYLNNLHAFLGILSNVVSMKDKGIGQDIRFF